MRKEDRFFKFQSNNIDAVEIKVGEVINECTMIVGKPYLKNYVMCYDNSLPKESRPIIAKIS